MDNDKQDGFAEYRLLILSEFDRINKSIERLVETRERDNTKLLSDVRGAMHDMESRIMGTLNNVKEDSHNKIDNMQEDISNNAEQITQMRIKSAGFGAISGVMSAILIELISFLLGKP